MPRASQTLLSTDREIAGAKPPTSGRSRAEYRISGTPNLVLRVTPEGRRSWVYWIKRPKTSRWQKFTIGPYPTITLAIARNETVRLKRSVLDGIDPIEARDKNRHALTIKALGDKYITRHAKPKKRSWAEDERKLRREVYPKLGNALIEQVSKGDLVALLDGVHDRGAPIQANRVLALTRKLFNWAVAEGYLERSPATGIPARAAEQPRTKTLELEEIQEFWLALDGRGFDETTADVLRVQLLLGARVREVAGMTRDELDLVEEMPTWCLPKARAKGNRDVVRPLPSGTLAIIRRRIRASPKSRFVFPSPSDERCSITPRAPARAVQRAAQRALIPAGFTPHDLRRTCRTGLAALGVAEIVAKKILGHAPPRSDVTASVYDQHTYLPEMMDALRRWEQRVFLEVAARIDSPGGFKQC